MNTQTQKVRDLTTLMCYIRASEYFDEESVHRVVVTWFHWSHTWRCTIVKHHMGKDRNSFADSGPGTTLSKNRLSTYIVNECFTSPDMVTIEIEVERPNSHQVVEASWRLAEILGPDVNLDEILF